MLGTYALSAGYYDAFYLKAQKVRTLIKRDFDRLWEAGFDALVAPTSPEVAWPFGAKLADPVAMYLADACTLPVNMAGLPGISIPCGLSDGLPVGLQLIGAPWSECELLRAARAYEGVTAGDGVARGPATRPRGARGPGGPDAGGARGGRRPALSGAARRGPAGTGAPATSLRADRRRPRDARPSRATAMPGIAAAGGAPRDQGKLIVGIHRGPPRSSPPSGRGAHPLVADLGRATP